MFRIIGGNRSIAKSHVDRKLSYPHDSVESRGYRISDNVQGHSEIRKSQQQIDTINVYSIEDKQVFSLRFTDIKRDKHIILLCTYKIPATTTLDTLLWIKNLSRLIRSQINGNENRKYFCKYNKKS